MASIGGVPYGVDGYRSDCRNSHFNGIVTFDHSALQSAWFLQQTNSVFAAAASTSSVYFLSAFTPPRAGITGNFQRFGLWTGYGAAAGQSYSFQVGVCASTITSSSGGFGVGLFISGLKGFCAYGNAVDFSWVM